MIEKMLRVLSQESLGLQLHASEILWVQYKYTKEHTCETCQR